MVRTKYTEPQCLYSTAILLLTLWAVRPVQSLSACTVQLHLHSPQCLYSTAIPLLPSVPVLYSYTSTHPMGRTVFTELQCLYSTAVPLLPHEPYGLYRSSVPVEYSYTSTPPMSRTAFTDLHCLYSTAIPLLPLWAVRPLQSLSACTVQLYLYSPYVPYGFYRSSVPVQYSYTSTPPMSHTAFTDPQCLYSTAIPLLPLWAVRTVQSLSACTVQLYLYSPQCLYSTAIPLLPLWAVRPLQSLSACTVQLYLYSPYGPYDLYRASVPVQVCTLPFLPYPLFWLGLLVQQRVFTKRILESVAEMCKGFLILANMKQTAQ